MRAEIKRLKKLGYKVADDCKFTRLEYQGDGNFGGTKVLVFKKAVPWASMPKCTVPGCEHHTGSKTQVCFECRSKKKGDA